jgi:hypothetical protein
MGRANAQELFVQPIVALLKDPLALIIYSRSRARLAQGFHDLEMIKHIPFLLSSFPESTISILQKSALPQGMDPASHCLTAFEMPPKPVIGIFHAHQYATE